MKFKPLHVYAVLAVAALFVLIFLTNQGTDESGLSGSKMPSDEVHQQFQEEQPGHGNVSSEFYAQLEEVRKQVEKNPNDTAKLKEYGDYLTAAHQFDAAIPVFEEILSKDPRRTDVYFALTFIYFNRRDWEKAEAANRNILSYDKNNLQAQYNLGAIASTKGDKEKAKEIWTKLSTENPDTRQGKLAAEGLEKLNQL
jgi:tetratricopeptide (TPR) repeat protein